MDQLELLLKSTVQNIKPKVEARLANQEAEQENDGASESGSEAEFVEEAIILEKPDQDNLDKILTLLDEIRDPFQGQSVPSMIGVEYNGPLYVI